jgi:hypothetical protein
VIPVFATIYTVNKRIKAQTRENHQPHLILDEIEPLKELDSYRYNLTLLGTNYRKLCQLEKTEKLADAKKELRVCTNLIVKNIGYGVSTNIKFYNLITSEQIYGSQERDAERNQKLFTTLDIAAGDTKKIPVTIVSAIVEEEGITLEDHNRILCVYKDLNNYVDNFIIAINVKPNGHYDFFAYQPSSKSYKKWIREGKKQYYTILKKYED